MKKLIFLATIILASLLWGDGRGAAQTANEPGSGNALSFNGSNHIRVGDVAILEGMASLSISAWIKTTSATMNSAIVSKWYSGTVSYILRLSSISNAGDIEFSTQTVGGTVSVNSTNTNVNDGNWHHITGTYDGSWMKVYVDGVLCGTIAQNGSIQNSEEELCIGNACNGASIGQGMSGNIDEVRIWSRALTQTEIRQNMTEKLNGNEASLVGYWRFDEGAGTTAFDSSPNGNDGTLQ